MNKMTKLKNTVKSQGMSTTGNGQDSTWESRLRDVIASNNKVKVNKPGPTKREFREKREDMIFNMFRILRGELNFMIEDASSLKTKHVEALMTYWIDAQLSPVTIDKKISVLRTLCAWVGKDGMVNSVETYAPNYRKTYKAKQRGTNDQSNNATAPLVSLWDAWDKINAKDSSVAAQFLLIRVFGAKRTESVNFRPLASNGDDVRLDAGVKGKKARKLPVDTEFKRAVIAALKNHVMSKGSWVNGTLGNSDMTTQKQLWHYANVLKSVGLTKTDALLTGLATGAECEVGELARRGLISPTGGDAISGEQVVLDK